MRPHLGYPASRLISALRLGERRPGRSRTSPNIIRGSSGRAVLGVTPAFGREYRQALSQIDCVWTAVE